MSGRRIAVVCGVAAALAGCATPSPDGGLGTVERASGHKLHWVRDEADRQAVEREVAATLAQPLSADDAVRVALLNNQALQASLFGLGIADAERVRAGRLPNPGFTFGHLAHGHEIERTLHIDLARLLALPLASRAATRGFERAQRDVALDVLALVAQTRKAYVDAIAADERARYAMQVRDAAEASAELARRMAQVGNWSRLQQAREQRFYADAALGFARAKQARESAGERLVRLLGLWGEQLAQLKLPERLPELPVQPRELPDVERTAIAQRLDVRAAKLDAEQTANNLGLARATRLVNVLELGLVRNSSAEAQSQRGYEITLELPLFDFGQARVAQAEAIYGRALARAAQTAVDARSEVRAAYRAYRHAYDIARHQRDEVMPLAKRIADENLLRYNGMLIGVFELLADARAQIASVQATIDALREFWIADADLDAALLGRPALEPPAGAPAMAVGAEGAGH
jgi:outer membrane protein TolC